MNEASEAAGYAAVYIVLFWGAVWFLFCTGLGRALITLAIIIGIPLALLAALIM